MNDNQVILVSSIVPSGNAYIEAVATIRKTSHQLGYKLTTANPMVLIVQALSTVKMSDTDMIVVADQGESMFARRFVNFTPLLLKVEQPSDVELYYVFVADIDVSEATS